MGDENTRHYLTTFWNFVVNNDEGGRTIVSAITIRTCHGTEAVGLFLRCTIPKKQVRIHVISHIYQITSFHPYKTTHSLILKLAKSQSAAFGEMLNSTNRSHSPAQISLQKC